MLNLSDPGTLQKAVSWANNIALTFLCLTAIASIIVWRLTSQLNDIAGAKVKQLEHEAVARAKQFDARLAEANQKIAEAEVRAKQLEVEIAGANAKAAEANERAAKANLEIEKLKKEQKDKEYAQGAALRDYRRHNHLLGPPFF